MRGPSLLLVALGLGCSFESSSGTVESGELEETATATDGTSGTTQGQLTTGTTSAGSSGATEPKPTTDTTDAEPTTSGETESPTAFVQDLVVTEAGDYDFQLVPLLVTLSEDNSQWDAIAPDFSNVKFVGQEEGKDVELPFEVDGVGDASVQLWVLVPEVSGQADRFRVEYGLGVSNGSWAPGDVWAAYETVWHLGEDPADPRPQYQDSSGNDRHITNDEGDAIPSEEMVPGIVGRAPRFAQDRELQISNGEWPDADIGDRFTVEAWVKYDEQPPSGLRTIVQKVDTYQLVGARNQADPLVAPGWSVHDGSTFRETVALEASWNQGPRVWNYVAATFERDQEVGQVRTVLYLDGAQAAVEETAEYDPEESAADFRIGRDLTATVDEVRVSFEARPASWFELQNRSMRNELLDYGEPMPL